LIYRTNMENGTRYFPSIAHNIVIYAKYSIYKGDIKQNFPYINKLYIIKHCFSVYE
jgi:hypothetical protein